MHPLAATTIQRASKSRYLDEEDDEFYASSSSDSEEDVPSQKSNDEALVRGVLNLDLEGQSKPTIESLIRDLRRRVNDREDRRANRGELNSILSAINKVIKYSGLEKADMVALRKQTWEIQCKLNG